MPLRRAGTVPTIGARYGPGSAAHPSASAARCPASGTHGDKRRNLPARLYRPAIGIRNPPMDNLGTSLAIAGVSVPHYWLGMVLVIIYSVQLNWLPAVGAGPGGSSLWNWDWEHIRYLILPAITTSVIPMGIIPRNVRA